jgi:hypothetical protein
MKTAANPEVAVQRFLSGIDKVKTKAKELRELSKNRKDMAYKLREKGFLEQALSEEKYASSIDDIAYGYDEALLILQKEQLI